MALPNFFYSTGYQTSDRYCLGWSRSDYVQNCRCRKLHDEKESAQSLHFLYDKLFSRMNRFVGI